MIPLHDVVIIGAGPAGLSAAIACRQQQLDVVVVDEFPKPGGRLLGQLHEEPNGTWWNGIKETEALLKEAMQLHTDIRCGVSVIHIDKTADHFQVYTNKGLLQSENLLIATGAAETPAPIPGWTLPGVMSIGAAQVMTNVHRVRVGSKGIIVGINVLSAAIARELQLADVALHSMALPARSTVTQDQGNPRLVMANLARIAHLAPSKFIRFGSRFIRSPWIRDLAVTFYPKSGIKMWGMPIYIRKAVTAINGKDQVESVTLCNITAEGKAIAGTEETIAVDFVCIAGGLYPLAELAAAIGCPFQYSEALGGHVPLHNAYMATPIAGLYVAGNITGIESAQVARAQGTLAGMSIAGRMAPNSKEIKQRIQVAADEVSDTREKATIQFHPDIAQGRMHVFDAYHNYVRSKEASDDDNK